jgi:neuralized-like protein 4
VCEYLNLCQRFKSTLALPDNFFAPAADVVCFCVGCCKVRGEEPYKKRGDPPREFSTPQGWVRFPLKVTSRPSWHVAYHGTRLAFLRKILDHGQLLPPGKCPLL